MELNIPKKFKANGNKEEKYGVGIIFTEEPASCALMLTSNKIKAAPLIISEKNAKNKIRAIIANSGNANAYTGGDGLKDAEKICELAGKLLGVKKNEIIEASTGVIGRRIDVDKIESITKEISKNLSPEINGFLNFTNAIRTTDRFPKIYSKKLEESGKEINIIGMAKGAGMIAPKLTLLQGKPRAKHATMLCFILTDLSAPEKELRKMLESAVNQSFNAAIVDGDTSTNDMVVLLANGAGENQWDEKVKKKFYDALLETCTELAKMIVRDGEGATKLFKVQINGAKSESDAQKAARAIAGSLLVKTAVYGNDPNWGRIIAALGYSGASFNPEKISLWLEDEKEKTKAELIEKGKIINALEKAKEVMSSDEFSIVLNLHAGKKQAFAYGCDLGHEYVKINAEYTT